LNQVENLKKLRDELDAQIAQLEVIANTFNVNEITTVTKNTETDEIPSIAKSEKVDPATVSSAVKQAKSTGKPVNIAEEQLDEMAKISEPIQNAITIATNRLKSQFPEITSNQIKDILTSKKKSPEYAPELVKALEDDEKMYGGGEKYVPGIGGSQTLRAVNKALGEYEPQPRGRKATEKPAAEPKAKAEPKAAKEKAAPAAKAAPTKAEPKAKMEPEDKADAAAMKAAAKSKGGTTRAEKYGMLRNELERVTAELKSLAGSPDMETRKKLSADKMRIELAMDKLKQVNI
jgi:hypothetical protein